MKNRRSYQKVLSRRTVLRGAAGVTVGLPFLEEMTRSSVFGAPSPVAARFVTMFFGQGLLPAWFRHHVGLAAGKLTPDPLLALEELKPRLGIYSGLHQSNSGTHAQSGVQCFTGIPGSGSTTSIRSKGPSIDQAVLSKAYTGGRAPTPVQTLAAASYFNDRNYSNQRHTWKADGQAAAQPYEEIADLFKAIMGLAPGGGPATPPPMNDAAAEKQRRYDKSVLDTVVEEYKRWTGDAMGLGKASRARITDHLEEVRSLEKRISGVESPTTPKPVSCSLTAPMNPLTRRALELSGAGSNDRVVDPNKWQTQWQVLVDTYAMALACDISRFGNVTFQAAGDHVRFRSPWKYKTETIDFTDNGESNHLSYFHATSGNENSPANTQARKHVLFNLAQVEYFLKKLDGVAVESGKSFLEECPVMVSTELGDGGGGHSTKNVFHAINGAGGRFKTGVAHMFDTHASNFYSAVLLGLGLDEMMGESTDRAARDKVAAQIRA